MSESGASRQYSPRPEARARKSLAMIGPILLMISSHWSRRYSQKHDLIFDIWDQHVVGTFVLAPTGAQGVTMRVRLVFG